MADDEYDFPHRGRLEQLADRWFRRFVWASVIGLVCLVLVGVLWP